MPLVIVVPFSPTLFNIGPLSVGWYGLAYVVAFIAGLVVAGRHLEAHGLPEADHSSLAFWAIIVGLLGARLYYDAQSGVGYYLANPQHLLAAWEGGMAYFGALWTVPIFLSIFCWRRGLPFWLVADAAALFAAVGQPIGRLGNLVNGDVVGYPSDLPWAVSYTNPASLAPQLGVAYQPAAAYELLIGLAILGVLLLARWRLHPRPGTLFIGYLALYGVSQFAIFFLRVNSITLFGLEQAQLSSLALLLLLVPLTIYWRRSPVDLRVSPQSDPTEALADIGLEQGGPGVIPRFEALKTEADDDHGQYVAAARGAQALPIDDLAVTDGAEGPEEDAGPATALPEEEGTTTSPVSTDVPALGAEAPGTDPGVPVTTPQTTTAPRAALPLAERVFLMAAALVALVGIGISAYLTAVHFSAAPLACTAGAVVNCERVLSSAYSVLLGTTVPTSAAGLLWFACSGCLALLRLARPKARLVARAQITWSGIGLVTVLLLVFIEIVRLGTICIWCTAAHGLVLLTFVLVALTLGRGEPESAGSTPPEAEAGLDEAPVDDSGSSPEVEVVPATGKERTGEARPAGEAPSSVAEPDPHELDSGWGAATTGLEDETEEERG